MDFVHLHCHSHYSLLDGLSKPKDLVQACVDKKMPAIAITDHGTMYGVIEFYQAAVKAGIKPIIGCEVYVAPNGHTQKRAGIDSKPYHLVLLAKNETGYLNLIALTTAAYMYGFYYKPRVDLKLLQKHSDGLIALSACLAGEVPRHILQSGKDRGIETIKKYQDIFGRENYYLEVQHHPGIPEVKQVNDVIIDLADHLKIPLIATNDSHYTNAEDAQAHDILLCIQTNRLVDDVGRMSMLSDDFSIKPGEEMAKDFAHVQESITNSMEIMDKCNLEIKFEQDLIPVFDVPDNLSESQYLRRLCFEGLTMRYGFKVLDILKPEESEVEVIKEMELPLPQADIIKRLNYELGVVDNMGFPGYFLIVWDFIRYARSIGIYVGPGRGSAAGSLLAFSLEITNLDPLQYDLLFERFLNPDRISMPDIDIDFEDTRREEVIKYVQQKYGKDRVCQISTFGTMAAKAAVKDVGRTHGIDFAEMNELAGKIPSKPGIKLADALEEVEFKEAYESNRKHAEIIDTALVLEGTVRQAGVHACAVIISKIPLQQVVPLQPAPGDDTSIISQYSMKPLEDLGCLKMDFLGLRNLSITRNALRIIKARHNIDIDIDKIPIDDKKAYQLFAKGETVGVFQFESSGMRRYLKELKPTVFEDIIAMVALYRPGPMQFIDSFIARKHGREPIKYDHPLMEESLKDTYGITVYQEQIMKLSRKMASFTGGQADTLRKAIGKKKADLMAKMKDEFFIGCKGNNISEAIAANVWKSWEAFAQYCFNKSHAACYALIAYQTAYLKSHYPEEFMAALMTADQENHDRITIDIEECRNMGIEVIAPRLNESYRDFSVNKENQILFGFKAIKNCGKGIIENILVERKANGIFKSLIDFIERVEPKNFNRKGLESLIKSGALDQYGLRGQLFANLEFLLQQSKNIHKQKASCQVSLFASKEAEQDRVLHLPPAAPFPKKEKLMYEKEYLGFYLSEHPFAEYSDSVKHLVAPIRNLAGQFRGGNIVIAGVIMNMKKLTTKKGDLMLFANVEDLTESVELLIFPKTYKKTERKWIPDSPVIIKGKFSDRDAEVKIIVQDLEIIDEDNMPKINKKFGNSNSQSYSFPVDNQIPVAPTTPVVAPPTQPIVPKPVEDISQNIDNEANAGDRVVFEIINMPKPKEIIELKQFLDASGTGDCRLYLRVMQANKIIQTDFYIKKEDDIIAKISDIVRSEKISYN